MVVPPVEKNQKRRAPRKSGGSYKTFPISRACVREKTGDFMSISQKQIKESLINQLKMKGADADLFLGLIDDYLFFNLQERKMQADVRKRGFSIETVSAQGKPYIKENPSVKNAVIYNRQKLAIISQLGLTTDGIEESEDDSDGL